VIEKPFDGGLEFTLVVLFAFHLALDDAQGAFCAFLIEVLVPSFAHESCSQALDKVSGRARAPLWVTVSPSSVVSGFTGDFTGAAKGPYDAEANREHDYDRDGEDWSCRCLSATIVRPSTMPQRMASLFICQLGLAVAANPIEPHRSRAQALFRSFGWSSCILMITIKLSIALAGASATPPPRG
jgi:hypothetical protein